MALAALMIGSLAGLVLGAVAVAFGAEWPAAVAIYALGGAAATVLLLARPFCRDDYTAESTDAMKASQPSCDNAAVHRTGQ